MMNNSNRPTNSPIRGALLAVNMAAKLILKVGLIRLLNSLQNIWKSKKIALKTKIKLYNSNVKSVILYGAECWRTVETEINKVNAFHNYCLRRICNIYWPNKI